MPQVLQLVPMYDEGLRAEDDETCRALCRVFTEMGEQYLHLILRSPQQWALPVVSAVLRGAAHPDREVAEITFNFWYILSEELAGSGRMLETQHRATCRELFVPAYVQLVDSLRLLVEYPSDSDTFTDDDRDDFKRFRYSVRRPPPPPPRRTPPPPAPPQMPGRRRPRHRHHARAHAPPP